MDVSNVCPMEDAIQAFFEFLVDPLLPVKSIRETPRQDKQEKVAKQVHAVVLLYNYFLRKRHPQLKYQDFESFCKTALVLRPKLNPYMKLMVRTDTTESGDLKEQLSLTERAIKNACDISRSLYASINVSSAEGWPVSKVAVLLINPTKENCILMDNSITEGVKSLIEKDVDESFCSPDGSIEAKHISKRKRIPNKHSQDELDGDECRFRKCAFSAVKEATKDGIKQSDLTIIESHIVPSLSKVNTTTRFYIMRCAQAAKVRWIPIRDIFDSLNGPFLQKISSEWMHSSVVSYFHLLPYARIISQWFSRDVSPICFDEHESVPEVVNINTIETTEEPFKPRNLFDGGTVEASRNSSSAETEKLNKKNGHCSNDLLDGIDGPLKMDVDNHSVVQYEKMLTPKNVAGRVQHDSQLKKSNSHAVHDLDGMTDVSKLEVVNPTVQSLNNRKDQNFANGKAASSNMPGQNGTPAGNHGLVICEFNSKDSAEIQAIASREPLLSETALSFLRSKRDKLVLQVRRLGDEIAQYDKRMQRIMNGSEDLSSKLDLLIEGCRESSNQGSTSKDYEDPSLVPCKKRTRLSEEAYSNQNPCQELDGKCQEKNWVLPTYEVFPSDGGYQSKVRIKGTNFESASVGETCPEPHQARGSAASKMLAKLAEHA